MISFFRKVLLAFARTIGCFSARGFCIPIQWRERSSEQGFEAGARSPARHYANEFIHRQNSTRRSRRSARPKRQRQGTVSFRKPGALRWSSKRGKADDRQRRRRPLHYIPILTRCRDSTESRRLIEQRDLVLARNRKYQPRFKAAFRESPAPTASSIDSHAKKAGYKIEVGLESETYNLMTLMLTDQLAT